MITLSACFDPTSLLRPIGPAISLLLLFSGSFVFAQNSRSSNGRDAADLPCDDFALALIWTDESCAGANDGAIDLTVINGTDPVIFDWNVDELDGIEDPAGMGFGLYSAVVTDGEECTGEVQVFINTINESPEAVISGGGELCAEECAVFSLNLSGAAPFVLNLEVDAGDGPQALTFTTQQADTTLELCPADLGIAAGAFSVYFKTIEDAFCQTILDQTEVITILPAASSVLDTILCTGEALVINGTQYDESNPSGTETFAGGSASGCDSMVQILLNFPGAVSVGLVGDTAICAGGTATLTFSVLGADNPVNLEYSNGIGPPQLFIGVSDGTTLHVSPQQTTTYTIGFAISGVTACPLEISSSATVAVSTLSAEAVVSSDFNGFGVSCASGEDGRIEVEMTGALDPISIGWSTGDTSLEVTGLSAGTYTVTITDRAGCTAESQAVLTEPVPIAVTTAIVPPSCEENGVGAVVIERLTGGEGPFEYSLDGQFFQPLTHFPFQINNLSPGGIDITVQDINDCSLTITEILPGFEELQLDLGQDISLHLGESASINAQTNFAVDSLVWVSKDTAAGGGELLLSVMPFETTTYILTVFNEAGCFVSDELTVFVRKDDGIFFPTAFSPNDDGLNDFFLPLAGSAVAEIKNFKIFDRWGNALFENGPFQPNAEDMGWNGAFRARKMNPGLFVYYAEVAYIDGRTEIFTGDFALLR